MPAKCAAPETVILNSDIEKLSDGGSENITIWRSAFPFLYQRASTWWYMDNNPDCWRRRPGSPTAAI